MDYGLALHKFGINNEIIVMIKALYDNSTSVVLINNTQGNIFKTTIGVIQVVYCYQFSLISFLSKSWPK